MKKNSERSAAMRFTMKLSILLTPFIALLVVYFLNDPFMVLRLSLTKRPKFIPKLIGELKPTLV